MKKLNCRYCGQKLKSKKVPVGNYSYIELLATLCTIEFHKFDSEGRAQELIQYECPNYGEKEGWWIFKKLKKHDRFANKIKGVKYDVYIAHHHRY